MTSTRLVLLLALALLSNACAPLMPPADRGTHLRYTPREAAAPTWGGGRSEQSPQRLHRRQDTREAVTAVGPGGTEVTTWGSALAAHLAFRGAVLDRVGLHPPPLRGAVQAAEKPLGHRQQGRWRLDDGARRAAARQA